MRILDELSTFLAFPAQFRQVGQDVLTLDEHGFALLPSGETGKKIDLLFTALIHGDEVVGLEAFNLVLSKLLKLQNRPTISIGFLLCNIAAAKAGKRFIETDLNRSFAIPNPISAEEQRAAQVASIVDAASFVFDIHQTVEPTESSFVIFGHDENLIGLAHHLLPELPIVTFPLEGFSQGGKTLNEYAAMVGARALSIECGQKGFSTEIAEQTVASCFQLIAELESPSPARDKKEIEVYYISKFIMNTPGACLTLGMTNFMAITAGQVLGQRSEGPILSPVAGRLFFPKYGELASKSPELCEIGVPRKVRI